MSVIRKLESSGRSNNITIWLWNDFWPFSVLSDDHTAVYCLRYVSKFLLFTDRVSLLLNYELRLTVQAFKLNSFVYRSSIWLQSKQYSKMKSYGLCHTTIGCIMWQQRLIIATDCSFVLECFSVFTSRGCTENILVLIACITSIILVVDYEQAKVGREKRD
jgi:hypothetical protein